MTTRAGAECRAADSVPGAVVFDAVGTVSFGGDGDASALDPPPGHAKLVAASSKHGVVCYADARGVYAIETDVLCDVASALKEKVPAEQVVPRDARGFTPMRRVSHVSFSADETVLAACVGGVVHLFETRAILEKCRDEALSVPIDAMLPVIERALGRPWDEVFALVERDAVGAASIAQAHRATLQSGEDVIIKIQHDKIAVKMRADLFILPVLQSILALGAPNLVSSMKPLLVLCREQGRTRERNSHLQRLLSRPVSTRFG